VPSPLPFGMPLLSTSCQLPSPRVFRFPPPLTCSPLPYLDFLRCSDCRRSAMPVFSGPFPRPFFPACFFFPALLSRCLMRPTNRFHSDRCPGRRAIDSLLLPRASLDHIATTSCFFPRMLSTTCPRFKASRYSVASEGGLSFCPTTNVSRRQVLVPTTALS